MHKMVGYLAKLELHVHRQELCLTFSISFMYLSLAAFWALRLLASAVACTRSATHQHVHSLMSYMYICTSSIDLGAGSSSLW